LLRDIGRQEGQPAKGGPATKNIVLTLVERGASVRSVHIDSTSIADIAPILRENLKRETGLITDQARHYIDVGKEFASHDAVNHGEDEYARYASRVDFPQGRALCHPPLTRWKATIRFSSAA
jgi:hypothetical protein